MEKCRWFDCYCFIRSVVADCNVCEAEKLNNFNVQINFYTINKIINKVLKEQKDELQKTQLQKTLPFSEN